MSDMWEKLQSMEPEIERESPEGQAWMRGMAALSAMQDEGVMVHHLEAADAFLEALALKPEWPEALLGLSYWLVLAGDEHAAIHYAQRTLAKDRKKKDARSLLQSLETTHHLRNLLQDVERMDNKDLAVSNEELLEVQQLLLLLQVHHQLLDMEVDQVLFHNPEQLHSRQRSLETLGQMLAIQMDKGFTAAPEQVFQQLEHLATDLERLKRMEHEIFKLRDFRADVQHLFRDMMSAMIAQRMGQSSLSPKKQYDFFRRAFLTLQKTLFKASPPLRRQMISLSGWQHLEQQLKQFEELASSHPRGH